MNLLSSLEATSPARLLPPCAESVVALAELVRCRSRQPLAPLLRRDPGARAAFLSLPARPASELEAAELLLRRLLARPQLGFADWTAPAARVAYQAASLLGHAARQIAESAGLPADELETLGQFLLLGRLAQTQEADASLRRQAPFALTRLLARRWSWPAWLREPLSVFDPGTRPPSGADGPAQRQQCLHAAWALVQEALPEAELAGAGEPDLALECLGLTGRQRDAVADALQERPTPPAALSADGAELLCRSLQLVANAEASGGGEALMRLEEELEAVQQRFTVAQAEVEQRLRDQKLEALAEFAAGAGHEINNPLAVISAQAQHLLKTEESLDRAKALERIIAQAQRIHQLLRDLMLYARPPEARFAPLRVEALVDAALRQAAELAMARDLSLTKAGRFGGAKLKGDVDLLSAALLCLVRNAIAAAPAGGWVKVSLADAEPGWLCLAVEDNGPGLPGSLRTQIFDPFFSGRNAGRGFGLGLPKAWRIAQLHGGRLRFESQPGEPTRFFLLLPQQPPAAAAPRPQRAAARRLPPPRASLRPAAKRRRG